VTLTAQPWTLTPAVVAELSRRGLDEKQVETAVGVVSMFNYFTRVADATGIEFDYETPLPAFQPDLSQDTAPRPDRPGASGQPEGTRPRPQYPRLRDAWETWRTYELETDEPISRRERRLLATVAAEEATDWEGVRLLGGPADGDERLIEFARKLSRQPWRMVAGDLERLRAAGYSEVAILHVISVVAHQNADSRLAIGLSIAAQAAGS
jgi:alkylhydroperoxidase family enzyme